MESLLEIENDGAIESRLSEEIGVLWGENTRVAGLKEASSAELRLLRAKLAERLFEMKALLSRPGRRGQWRGWLSTVGIPRSTGDRLVERHAETMGIVTEDAPLEAITPEQESERLVQSLMPRLRRVLVTPLMAYQFLCALVADFGLDSEIRDGSLLLLQPSAEQESADEPEPRLQHDDPTPDAEPSLQHDEPIHRVGHSRYAGFKIAEPWSGYRQGQS